MEKAAQRFLVVAAGGVRDDDDVEALAPRAARPRSWGWATSLGLDCEPSANAMVTIAKTRRRARRSASSCSYKARGSCARTRTASCLSVGMAENSGLLVTTYWAASNKALPLAYEPRCAGVVVSLPPSSRVPIGFNHLGAGRMVGEKASISKMPSADVVVHDARARRNEFQDMFAERGVAAHLTH